MTAQLVQKQKGSGREMISENAQTQRYGFIIIPIGVFWMLVAGITLLRG